MDIEAALEWLDRTISLCEDYAAAAEYASASYYTGLHQEAVQTADEIDHAVQGHIAVARDICAANPKYVKLTAITPAFTVPNIDRWERARDALRTLRAGLASSSESARILGPKGPSMSAANLHPSIWQAALYLWNDGHYRAAVQTAATMLETTTKAKLGVSLSGADLFRQAFTLDPPKPGKPRLRLPIDPSDSDRWTHQHEGAMNLGAGAMQMIRNETTHSTDELTPDVAFEFLAVLSTVARQVERASVLRDI